MFPQDWADKHADWVETRSSAAESFLVKLTRDMFKPYYVNARFNLEKLKLDITEWRGDRRLAAAVGGMAV